MVNGKTDGRMPILLFAKTDATIYESCIYKCRHKLRNAHLKPGTNRRKFFLEWVNTVRKHCPHLTYFFLLNVHLPVAICNSAMYTMIVLSHHRLRNLTRKNDIALHTRGQGLSEHFVHVYVFVKN